MALRLRYDLTGPGWAECAIELNGQHAIVTASYLTDALDDLCHATVRVLRGGRRSQAIFTEEPGEYRWVLDRIDERTLWVQLIDRVITPENRTGTVIIDSACDAAEFGRALLSELHRLLALHGDAGYLAQWIEFPFPHDRIGELSALLEDA